MEKRVLSEEDKSIVHKLLKDEMLKLHDAYRVDVANVNLAHESRKDGVAT